MFVFGQLILAAILCALPFVYLGEELCISAALYLSIANITTLYAWNKTRLALLKVTSTDMSYTGFVTRVGIKKAFNGDRIHWRVFLKLLKFAPAVLIFLFILRIGNYFITKKLISLLKKQEQTYAKQTGILWLEDFRDNGLFRTKL